MNYTTREVEINGVKVLVEYREDYANKTYTIYAIVNTKTGEQYIGLTGADVTPFIGMPFVNARTVWMIVGAAYGKEVNVAPILKKYGSKCLKFTVVKTVSGIDAAMQAEKDAIADAKANGISLYNLSDGGEARIRFTQESYDSLCNALYALHNMSKKEIAKALDIRQTALDGLSSDPDHFGYHIYKDDKGEYIVTGNAKKLYLPLQQSGLEDEVSNITKFTALSPKAIARVAQRKNLKVRTVRCAAIEHYGKDALSVVRITKDNGVKIRKDIRSGKYTDIELCIKWNITEGQLATQKYNAKTRED